MPEMEKGHPEAAFFVGTEKRLLESAFTSGPKHV
jgi:hypothetical protein